MSTALDDLDILEETMFGVAPDTSEPPEAATSIAEANRWAGHLKKVLRRRAEFQEMAQAQRDALDQAIAERMAKFDRDIEWYEEALREFHRTILEAEPDRTTIALPNGELKKTHGGVEWDIVDEDALTEWAEEEFPSILAEEKDPPPAKVNKNFLKDQFKPFGLAGGSGPQRPRYEDGRVILDDGSVVPGLVVKPKPDKITVVTT